MWEFETYSPQMRVSFSWFLSCLSKSLLSNFWSPANQEALICSVCQYMRCKYFCCGQFQMAVMLLSMELERNVQLPRASPTPTPTQHISAKWTHAQNWWILKVEFFLHVYAAAAAKSLQSCPTLCDPIGDSPPDSPIPGILQARTLERVAISFSSAWKWKIKVKPLSRVQLFVTPWTIAIRLLHPWDFPSKSTGVGCRCFLWHVYIQSKNIFSVK